jgi:hypothetical protein
MKNIHLLPTEDKSRITKYNKELHIEKIAIYNEPSIKMEVFNMYITSEEEIKEGEYGLSRLGEIIKFHSGYDYRYYAKIILTTDPDLIADGVQAIDDEFLEWFVKNPSCEFVEVPKWFDGLDFLEYIIIIPQEEPKQETLEAAMYILQNSTYGAMGKVCDEEPKQETLEEAAENYCSNSHAINEDRASWQDIEFAFKDGAEWQAKRMYSEEDMRKAYDQGIDDSFDIGFSSKDDTNFNAFIEQFKKK